MHVENRMIVGMIMITIVVMTKMKRININVLLGEDSSPIN
jgi:hypothetical protein